MTMRRSKRRQDHPPIIDARETPIGAVMDEASQRDRAYFETHPGVTSYRRLRVAGELGPVERDADRLGVVQVEVTQIRPGIRVRAPVVPGMQPHAAALISDTQRVLRRQEQGRNSKNATRQRAKHPHRRHRR
jgi:hypothetical protein